MENQLEKYCMPYCKEVSEYLDAVAAKPVKYKLKWNNKNISINIKRRIRRYCNKFKIENKIAELYQNLFVYGSPRIPLNLKENNHG